MNDTAPTPLPISWESARRAVLDHVLALVTKAPFSDALVLRGSMAMLAWAGPAARTPGDLDWIVLDRLAVSIDEEHPYPYVRSVETVQQWPEAAAGAARYDLWRDENFDTGGAHPRVPPDGLKWVPNLAEYEPKDLYPELVDLLREEPQVAEGIRIDPEGVRESPDWSYAYADNGTPGLRVLVPWRADGYPPDDLHLDFAFDESLPDPPVWAAVPRSDGGPPTAARAASRESSLAWKLLWLYSDARWSIPQPKDLYDAVLLAESDQIRLTPQLLLKVLRRSLSADEVEDFGLDSILIDDAEWTGFQADHPQARGTADQWLSRLRGALRQSGHN
jgi:Nucleotidyl transferase AbiEii toxin, Type IV TA system